MILDHPEKRDQTARKVKPDTQDKKETLVSRETKVQLDFPELVAPMDQKDQKVGTDPLENLDLSDQVVKKERLVCLVFLAIKDAVV